MSGFGLHIFPNHGSIHRLSRLLLRSRALPIFQSDRARHQHRGSHDNFRICRPVTRRRFYISCVLCQGYNPLALPAKRITVNLAPADLPKEGSHYDLPIAIGVMAAIGAIPPDALNDYTVLGELALDATITSVAGVLPAAIAANFAGTD
jgi:hypothetical protein